MNSARLGSCVAGALSLFIHVSSLFAAEGDILWYRTYGGSLNQVAVDVIQCSDGGYALAGIDGYSGSGNEDFLLIRTDAAGNES